ncbi:hypothetical protein [Kitasatospora sp. GP82]|uniref:hypothetical protein n=1 Tax=Kitasatospora sp. GP82 TaxID=3035089 RepID=UPI002474C894|nr:hypothetical protein [Kitasatospora sp. GP82]MDH6129384.1 hypothetical protein [Kitasatospora sp. GP82]
MTEQTLTPGAADQGDSGRPESRVIIPTRVLPAADQPPKPDFPPFNQQDRAGLATITDAAPAAARPPVFEQRHDPNPAWWRDLATKAMGTQTEEVVAPTAPAPAAEPPPVTATVTVKTTLPRRPSRPPGNPSAAAGNGSGGGWNGRGPGPGAPPEDPPSHHSTCPNCGGEFTSCSCPLHKTPQTPPAQAAPPQEDETEEVEQEVTVEVRVGENNDAPKSKFKPPTLREALKPTPNNTGNGWHRARLLWTANWIGPVVPAWGFDILPKMQHLILWFHEPGGQFWMSVTFVGAGAWIGWRTRGWYPPLAWVLRIPFATALVAALTVVIHLT